MFDLIIVNVTNERTLLHKLQGEVHGAQFIQT